MATIVKQIIELTTIVLNQIETLIISKFTKVGKGQFVSIKGYENKYGEVSNVVVQANCSYSNAKKKDIKQLKNLTGVNLEMFTEHLNSIKTIVDKNKGKDLNHAQVEAYIQDYIFRLENPSKKRSEAQINAYYPIEGTSLKIHKETGNIHFFSFQIYKEVLIEGNYPTVNSRIKTLIEKEISKFFKLRMSKFKNYIVSPDKLDSLTMNKETMHFINAVVIDF